VRDANASQLDYQHAAGFWQLREELAALVSGKLDSSIFLGKGLNIAPAET
jgi:hypothetical protein